MGNLEIRSVKSDEVPVIREVQRQAFGGRESEARLVETIHEADGAVISLLAKLDGRVVGHILFSEVMLDTAYPAMLGLAPVGVLPEEQGVGIGSALIRAGLKVCRRTGYEAVVVLGEPSYYRRFGFLRARDFGLDNEYGADDAFMALELADRALESASGTVLYRAEFRAL